MSETASSRYTGGYVVLEGGRVAFECSTDNNQWPWLNLHPFDPIVVQSINYWASIESAAARGTFDTAKRSALTTTTWTCGDPGVGHATHGIADDIGDEDALRYRLMFFDARGAVVYDMIGTGVVFKNRDFESWRSAAKQQRVAPMAIDHFEYAPAAAAGVATQAECFVSPMGDGTAQALITADNGFMPRHPTHGGSGDHVNANQLADVTRQFASMLRGGAPLICTAGEMRFTKYVELGQPIDLALEAEPSEHRTSVTVHQAGHLCATITLTH